MLGPVFACIVISPDEEYGSFDFEPTETMNVGTNVNLLMGTPVRF